MGEIYWKKGGGCGIIAAEIKPSFAHAYRGDEFAIAGGGMIYLIFENEWGENGAWLVVK